MDIAIRKSSLLPLYSIIYDDDNDSNLEYRIGRRPRALIIED